MVIRLLVLACILIAEISAVTSSFDSDSSFSTSSSSEWSGWHERRWKNYEQKRRERRMGEFLEKLFRSAHLDSNEIYVDGDTPFPKRMQNGSKLRPFSSLQAALDIAQDLASDFRYVYDEYCIMIAAGDYMPDDGYDSFEITGNAKISLVAIGPVTLRKQERIRGVPMMEVEPDIDAGFFPRRLPPHYLSPLIRWTFEPMPIQNNYYMPALTISSLHTNAPLEIQGDIEVANGIDGPISLELQAHVHGNVRIEPEAQITLRKSFINGSLSAARSDLTTAEGSSFYGPVQIGMYGIIDSCQFFNGIELHATRLSFDYQRPSIIIQSYLAGSYSGPMGTSFIMDQATNSTLGETHAALSQEMIKTFP